MLTELLSAFGIVAICVVIHVVGIVVFADWLLKRRAMVEQRAGLWRHIILLIMVFVGVLMLHLLEAAIWAVFYQRGGLFADFETSFYFSLTSYTTVGYGDMLLPHRWRLLGCMEALTGALLTGLSTAFIFLIMNGLFRSRAQKQQSNA